MAFCYECKRFNKKDTECSRMGIAIKRMDMACYYFDKAKQSDFVSWTCPYCKKEYQTIKSEIFANCPKCRISLVLKNVAKKETHKNG